MSTASVAKSPTATFLSSNNVPVSQRLRCHQFVFEDVLWIIQWTLILERSSFFKSHFSVLWAPQTPFLSLNCDGA